MSNLGQFYGSGFPIGAALSLPWNGDVVTFGDGSQWMAQTPTAPFAYTSDYSYLPDSMITPHPLLPGFNNGLFLGQNSTLCFAYKPSTGFYCTGAVTGSSSGTYYYYTSADGINWTQRQFPQAINYDKVFYIAALDRFFAVAAGVTTNGLLYSSDAITWTATSLANAMNAPEEILYNGTNLVLLGNGTAANYSTNSGASWNTITVTSKSAGTFPGSGFSTWSQSAGLFIAQTTTLGNYQTSPDGATWTLRSSSSNFLSYSGWLGSAASTKFAASATKIVVMGNNGFYMNSTDGLTWTNPGYLPSISTNAGPPNFYFDGTRFVARFSNRVFYSTDGLSWIEGKYLGGILTSILPVSNGVLFGLFIMAVQSKCLRVSNVTATTPQVILPQAAMAQATLSTVPYHRIR